MEHILLTEPLDMEALLAAKEMAIEPEGAVKLPPPRNRDQSRWEYETVMDGMFIHTESMAVDGFMLIDLRCRVYGQEQFYTTAEPRNLEPIEILVKYMPNERPGLYIYDWWTRHHFGDGWKFIRWIDDAFIRDYCVQVPLPSGTTTLGFRFFTGYLPKNGYNHVAIRRNTGPWDRIPLNNQNAGMPAPAGDNASGWTVLEFKREPGNPMRYPDIPSALGFGINAVLDNTGNLIPLNQLKLEFKQNSNQYRVIDQTPTRFAEQTPY